jgi:YbbR domain-containing protein
VASRVPELLTRNWTLKLAALGLAVLLWSVVKAEAPVRVTIPDVPVEVALRDGRWTATAPPVPGTVTVVFSGPVRDLVKLAVERPRVVIPIDEVTDTTEIHLLQPRWVQLGQDLERTRAEDILPSTVRLSFERITTRLLPVLPVTEGEPPVGFRLEKPVRADPPAITVSGPSSRLAQLEMIRLPAVDISELTGPTAITVAIDTTELDGLAVSPRQVTVTVSIEPVPPDSVPEDSAAVAAATDSAVAGG